MCHHFIMIDRAEVMDIAREIARDLAGHEHELASLDPLESYRADLARPADPAVTGVRDAFPASVAALIAPTGHGAQLAVADMVWGFEVTWARGPVFNTRIESALGGTSKLWRESFARRRCLVPARAFFESHATETMPSARTGKPTRRSYQFERADGEALLLAAVHDAGRFSLVTTEPNATVSPVHNRMPLVVERREAALWLSGVCEPLLDRDAVALTAQPAQ